MRVLDRISSLRQLMKKHNIDAYIIPTGDAHCTEYIADYWQSVKWVSGFSGSYGAVVITSDNAGLWTDGRYFLQAELELKGSGIELFRIGEEGVKTYKEVLADTFPDGGVIGFDGRVFSATSFSTLKSFFNDNGVNFRYSYHHDLIGDLWHDRPPLPSQPAFEHPPCFAGKNACEKLAEVRDKMKSMSYTAYIVAGLDSVAWLLNIRGSDSHYLPVVYAYAIITEDEAHVFIDSYKATAISDLLTSQGFILHEYTHFIKFISKLSTHTVYYNEYKANVLLMNAIPEGIKVINNNKDDIIPSLKAIKTKHELGNIKNAFISEGIAMVKTLKRLDDKIADTTQELSITEGDIVCFLKERRKEQPHYLCDSFPTIAAYGENAAIVHYRSGSAGAALRREGLLLIDTGGQYLNGTTDTTRMVPLGKLTDEMINRYTLVLKCNIALGRTVFKEGTSGAKLDTLARQHLWNHGLDYNHGTGHGLGYCLSIHEGPHSIHPANHGVPLSPGMLVSNEPGFYKAGCYGIRIENILQVVENKVTECGTFYAFETLTLCPINMKAVDLTLLTDAEVEWINTYHQHTYSTLERYLSTEEQEWLWNATLSVKRATQLSPT